MREITKTDYFALFQEPRRPWLDLEALKSKFLALSAEYHPDRFPNASEEEKITLHDRFTLINTAYQCLREPKERLQHLLELERGEKPLGVRQEPPETMALYLEIGQFYLEIDKFLAEKNRATSFILKAQYYESSQEWIEKLNHLHVRLLAQREQLHEELQKMNEFWVMRENHTQLPANTLPLDRLEQRYRQLSYVERWLGQLQERMVQLAF